MTATSGEAIMTHRFREYAPYKGEITQRSKGSMISMETGSVTEYALNKLQDITRTPGLIARGYKHADEPSWDELFFWIKKHGNEYDVIHIHGLWHFAGLAPYLAGVKTPKCVTIHGLLDRWALANGYWKKKLFFIGKQILLRKLKIVFTFINRFHTRTFDKRF